MWILLPCKHIFAMIKHSEVSLDDMPLVYRFPPYFNMDTGDITIPAAVPAETN